MTGIKTVTETFSVAPQIRVSDLDAIAAAGFKTIISNRPDDEDGPGQPRMAELEARSHRLGLKFVALPIEGAPSRDVIRRTEDILSAAAGPILAYCRSGGRAITAWAMASAGRENNQSILNGAAKAGFDLSPIGDLLGSDELFAD